MLQGLDNVLKKKKITKAVLARHMNVDPNTVYRWASCLVDPGTEKTRIIAEYVGVATDDLINPPKPSLQSVGEGAELPPAA